MASESLLSRGSPPSGDEQNCMHLRLTHLIVLKGDCALRKLTPDECLCGSPLLPLDASSGRLQPSASCSVAETGEDASYGSLEHVPLTLKKKSFGIPTTYAVSNQIRSTSPVFLPLLHNQIRSTINRKTTPHFGGFLTHTESYYFCLYFSARSC